jgi:hypothetical protein
MAGLFMRGRMSGMDDHYIRLLATSLPGDPDWTIVVLSVLIVIGTVIACFLAYHKSKGWSFSFSLSELLIFITSVALYLGAFAYVRYWINH